MPGDPIKAYCISCGEDVPVTKVSIGIEGEELLQCVHCHSFLGTLSKPQTLAAPAQPPQLVALRSESPAEFRPDESGPGHPYMPEMPGSVGGFSRIKTRKRTAPMAETIP